MPRDTHKYRNVFEIPLKYIHQKILSARNKGDAAESLGVLPQKLSYLFMNLINPETGEYVSFDEMKNKWKNEDEGRAFWGKQYDEPVKEIIVELEDLNLYELFSLIQKYKIKTINALSEYAHTSHSNIKFYLARFVATVNNTQVVLNFDILKKIGTREQLKTALGSDKYQELVDAHLKNSDNALEAEIPEITQVPIVHNNREYLATISNIPITEWLQHHPLYILSTVANSKTYNDASIKLGTRIDSYINKTLMASGFNQGKLRHFDGIKEFINKIFRDNLYVSFPDAKISWENCRLNELHDLIMRSSSLDELEIYLGIEQNQLKNELKKLSITYKELRNFSVAQALKTWGLNYYLPLKEVIIKRSFTVRDIHQAILSSPDVQTAEKDLKLPHGALNFFLKYCILVSNYECIPLSFNQFKASFPDVDSALAYYRKEYNEIMLPQMRPFNDRTFAEIYQVIRDSDNLIEAAAHFEMSADQFDDELKKLSYWKEDNNLYFLSYQSIKQIWPEKEDAQSSWQHTFYETMEKLKADHHNIWSNWKQTRNNYQSVEYPAEQDELQSNINVQTEAMDVQIDNYNQLSTPAFFSQKRKREIDEMDEPANKRRKLDNLSDDEPSGSGADETNPITVPKNK